MKIKHVSIVERHVEKIILGCSLLLGLLVYWLYATGEPYTVDVGSRKNVTPDQVEEVVAYSAKSLESAIKSGENPLPQLVVPQYTNLFRRRLDQNLNTAPDGKAIVRFDVPLNELGLDHSVVEPPAINIGMRPYYVVKPPAPRLERVIREHGVLGVVEDQAIRDSYIALVGDTEPLDFRYITVEGEFDFGAWQQRLRSQEVPAGFQPIPEDWWRNLMLLTAVVLERQTMQSNGQWGETEEIATVPSGLNFRGVDRPLTAQEAQEMVGQIREEQLRITESKLPLVGAQEEGGLGGGHLSLEDQKKLQQLNEQVNALQARMGRLHRQARLGIEVDDSMAFDKPVGLANMRRMEEQLVRLQKQRDVLLGISGDERFATRPGDRKVRGVWGGSRQDDEEDAEYLNQPHKVTLRAYDLTAVPSAMYRYRLKVEVISPLFRRQLDPEQRQVYFHKISWVSEASAWTEPVRVEHDKEFFLVASNPPYMAKFEVWTVFNGKRRKEEFDVRPGDRVGRVVQMREGAVSADVDLRLGVVLVDVDLSGAGGRGLTRALIYDPAADQMFERMLGADRQSDRRKRLQQEAAEAGKFGSVVIDSN